MGGIFVHLLQKVLLDEECEVDALTPLACVCGTRCWLMWPISQSSSKVRFHAFVSQ